MKLSPLLSLILALLLSSNLNAEGVIGFWKTISDQTGKAESIIGIYEYQGLYFGRIIATYNDQGGIQDDMDHPKERAPGVVGRPFYSGLDIIWDLKKENNVYKNGKIMDPEKGRIYDAEMWLKNGNLIVRGKIWIFGANQEWLPVKDSDLPAGFKKPDLTEFIPSIPIVNSQKQLRDRRNNR